MTDLLMEGARLADGRAVRILVLDGRIAAIEEPGAPLEFPAHAHRVDVASLVAAPGFIDLQVNGACGRDITDDPASMWAIGESLASHGVTAFLATIVTSEVGRIGEAVDEWTRAPASAGAMPIGLHLEGPYLSAARAGAHRPEELRLPDRAEASRWTPEVGVRVVTLAPELPGALELIAELSARGIVVAAGHTDGDAEIGRAAVDAGVRYATHLFNAMRPLDNRAAPLAAALLDDDRVTIGLIADGLHVAPEMIALVRRMVGPRLSLVSDAMAGLDMAPGTVRLGAADVLVGPDGARLADGTLAGSIAGLDVGVRTLVAATGCDLADALATVTTTPAKLLGLAEGRGRLEVGGRADLTLLTTDLEVVATLVAGEVAWSREPDRWA